MRFNSRLKIDLGWFAHNIDELKKLAPHNQIVLMVKSNAYGHGMVPIAREAIHAGVKEFGVASLGEGITLRKHLPQKDFEIYVFSDLECYQDKGWGPYLNNRLIPVISNKSVLSLFLNDPSTRHIPLVLKFNTGMNRLGFLQSELPYLISELKTHHRTHLFHIMSHFACASQLINEQSFSFKQYQNFKIIKQELIHQGFHIERSSMANSGAIEQGFALEETHIRPGLMVYGPSSLNHDVRPMGHWKGVMISELSTHIIQVNPIQKGMPIGYGAVPSPKDGLLTLLALGYGDGLFNHFRHITVSLNSYLGEAVGRINMDMLAILWEHSAASQLKLGTPITLWSHQDSRFNTLSDQNQISPYEILCGLSERIPRIYFHEKKGG